MPSEPRSRSTALFAFLVWSLTAACEAQVQFTRKAPRGFEEMAQPSSERTLSLRGTVQERIIVIAGREDARTVMLVPASAAILAGVLTAHGVHPRAARIWAQSPEFTLGRTSCLPSSRSPGCIPALIDRLHETGDFQLVLAPVQAQSSLTGGNTFAALGGAYAYTGVARDAAQGSTLSLGLATQGMLTARDRFLEYDVGLSGNSTPGRNSMPALVPRYNLLVAGAPVGEQSRGFAGLFRASGGWGGASASQFFIKPKLLGLALRSDGQPLQDGSRSIVKVTLLSPARVTLLSGGRQLYSGMHGIGEQIIAFDGRAGNFVDVLTQEPGGHEERFEAAVSGDNEAPAGAAWQFEAGRTWQDAALAGTNTAPSRGVVTVAHHNHLGSTDFQVASQATSARLLRLGASVTRRSSDISNRQQWNLAGMMGRYGESGLSGDTSTLILGMLDLSASASRYRPPTKTVTGTGIDPCDPAGGMLCYAALPYSQAGITLGLADLPVRLTMTRTGMGNRSSRNVLLQGSIPLPFAGRNVQLFWGARASQPSGAASIFFYLTFPFDNVTQVSSTLSADKRGQGYASASYSHQFEDGDAWPATISQAVQHGFGRAGSQTSWGHQLAGRVGAVDTNLSAHHSTGFFNLNATASGNYGISGGNVAFSHDLRDGSHTQFSANSTAALKVVNDSLDAQTLILGMRTIEVPPQSSRLIPIPPGYAPEISISPGPVAAEAASAMPDYLFPSNIKEIRVRRGTWHRVKFIQRPALADAPVVALRASHMREQNLDADEVRLYQDSQGFAFIFEPATDGQRIRFIANGMGQARSNYRCVADKPPESIQPGIYPELTYWCDLLPKQP